MDGTNIRDLIQGIGHLVVEVADLDAAEAFYRDGLGMRALGRDLWPEAGANAVMAAGAGRLVLALRPGCAAPAPSGIHQAYRASARAREAIGGRLAALGVAVASCREDRPAEAADNFYAVDPSGNRVQIVAHGEGPGDGVTGIDHACMQDYDLQWSEDFYRGLLGLEVDHISGLETEDYLRAVAWAEGKVDMAPGCCRMVRYYKKVNGVHPMLPRPTLQLYLRAGSQIVGIYLALEDYAEPPEEQLTGTPRTAFALAPGGVDALARALEAARHPFDGPVSHGGNAGPRRALYCKAPGGNFIEFSEQ